MEQIRKKPFFKKYKRELKAYALIGIPLIWWGIFFIYALGSAIYFSFTDLTFSIDKISEITFKNYARIFSFGAANFDPVFWKALGISAIWTAAMMLGNNFMGLFLSFMLQSLKRGRKLFLTLLFWPSLISAVVSADITNTIFTSEAEGLANQIVRIFGGNPIAWFDSGSNVALVALMVTPFLLGFCTKLIIYYSAILSVPATFYEAAKMETSSSVKQFIHITLPLIKNAIVLNMLLSLIDGIKILGPMQLVTNGGPDDSTLSAVLYIYNLAFGATNRAQMGRASAYAIVLFIIILIFTLIQLKISGKEAENVSAG